MPDSKMSPTKHEAVTRHEFLCAGETWFVSRHTSAESSRTGLRFGRAGETRFLPFTQGALPSDRELDSMTVEVLRIFLLRAAVQ
jgi:hypothetical protein